MGELFESSGQPGNPSPVRQERFQTSVDTTSGSLGAGVIHTITGLRHFMPDVKSDTSASPLVILGCLTSDIGAPQNSNTQFALQNLDSVTRGYTVQSRGMEI